MERSSRQANQTPRLSPLTPRCTRAKEKRACRPKRFSHLRFLGFGPGNAFFEALSRKELFAATDALVV
jgi:hypothetical protein